MKHIRDIFENEEEEVLHDMRKLGAAKKGLSYYILMIGTAENESQMTAIAVSTKEWGDFVNGIVEGLGLDEVIESNPKWEEELGELLEDSPDIDKLFQFVGEILEDLGNPSEIQVWNLLPKNPGEQFFERLSSHNPVMLSDLGNRFFNGFEDALRSKSEGEDE